MPSYVKFYLQEVKRHFSEVVLVINEKEVAPEDLAFFNENNIILRRVVNEGYDFGMYYKMLREFNVKEYDRWGLINDSCILFKKLDYFFEWMDKEKPDLCSLIDSNEISYHLQSYFLVINKNAIPIVVDYFKSKGIIKDYLEIVMQYELGLSAYLINAGLRVKSYYSCGKQTLNPTFLNIKNLIKEGFPLIKKKIITRDYIKPVWVGLINEGFDPFPMHYIRLIKRLNRNSYPDNIFSELIVNYGSREKFKYAFDYTNVRLRAYWNLIGYYRKRAIIKITGKNA